jgi:hypothetical protein
MGQRSFRCHSRHTGAEKECPTVVTRLIESATHRFVEPEFAQLIALFAMWRQDIDSEPFAHESDWATVDSPAFRSVSAWPQQQGAQPHSSPGSHPCAQPPA